MPSNSQSWLIFLASHSSPFSHSVFLFDLRVTRLLIAGHCFLYHFYNGWCQIPIFSGPLDFGSLKKATSKSSNHHEPEVRSLANGGSSQVEGAEAEDFGAVGKTYEGWIDLGQVMFGLKWAF